ncbi:peptidase, partial [Streptomyces sp. NPDC059618]
MVAPAVLAAAQKAAKVAKTAKKARQAASGGGGKNGGKGKDKGNLKLWLVLGGSGGLLTFGGTSLVIVLLMGMIGGTGNGAVAAACGDYADNAGAGNTSD